METDMWKDLMLYCADGLDKIHAKLPEKIQERFFGFVVGFLSCMAFFLFLWPFALINWLTGGSK
jgi:hypothetical protein